jgi:hypothetical protein
MDHDPLTAALLCCTRRRPRNREPCLCFLLAVTGNFFPIAKAPPGQKLIAHSSDGSASKIPSSNQNWKPSNFARIAVEEIFRGTSSPRVAAPVMINSGDPPAACRNARSDAVSTPGSAWKSCSRTAIASRTACSETVPPLTCRGKSRSHLSAGLANQSHSATSPRHSSRSNRSGARDNSPNRISLFIARPKSAIPHKTRIASPRNAVPEPKETQAR